MISKSSISFMAVVLGLLLPSECLFAQLEFEREPILYEKQPPQDPIARLIKKLERGRDEIGL